MMASDGTQEISLPVLSTQRKFWEVHRLNPDTNADNIVALIPVPVGTGLNLVRDAVARLLRRHEMLRTRYEYDGTELLQVILQEVGIDISEIVIRGDLREFTVDSCHAEELRHCMEDPFDLSQAPILRAIFIRFSASQESRVLLVTNHSIMDGWSLGLVKREFFQMMELGVRDAPKYAGPVKQFRQVSAERDGSRPSIARQRDYWLRQLEDVRPTLAIPTMRPRDSVSRESLEDCIFGVGGRSWDELMLRAQLSAKSSPTMIYIAALAASLLDYADGEIVIGNVYGNRRLAADQEVVGLLFNVVPVRIGLAGIRTVRDLINRVRMLTLEGYQNGDVPMEDVATALGFGQAVLGDGPPLWEVAVNVSQEIDAQATDIARSEFDRWLPSVGGRPIMERWDGRILELIRLSGHPSNGSGGFGGVVRYNSEVLDRMHASAVSGKVVDFVLRLPSILDDPIRTVWKRGPRQ